MTDEVMRDKPEEVVIEKMTDELVIVMSAHCKDIRPNQRIFGSFVNSTEVLILGKISIFPELQ
jgi:hypothetical protein